MALQKKSSNADALANAGPAPILTARDVEELPRLVAPLDPDDVYFLAVWYWDDALRGDILQDIARIANEALSTLDLPFARYEWIDADEKRWIAGYWPRNDAPTEAAS